VLDDFVGCAWFTATLVPEGVTEILVKGPCGLNVGCRDVRRSPGQGVGWFREMEVGRGDICSVATANHGGRSRHLGT
jgi:hypothetical protein